MTVEDDGASMLDTEIVVFPPKFEKESFGACEIEFSATVDFSSKVAVKAVESGMSGS